MRYPGIITVLAVLGICLNCPCGNPELSVMGWLRQPSSDLVVLADGEKIKGPVLNSKLNFSSAYGDLSFPLTSLAGIDLSSDSGTALIYTERGGCLSGYPGPGFLKLDSTPERSLQMQSIRYIVFRKRQTREKPMLYWVSMKNGDLFNASVRTRELYFSEAPRTYLLTRDLKRMDRLGFCRFNIFTIDGKSYTAKLRNSEMELESCAGLIRVFPDMITLISLFPPENGLESADVSISLRAGAEPGLEFDIQEALLIREIDPDSPFFGSLQTGDRILSCNGLKYRGGMLSEIFSQIRPGNSDLISVQRGDRVILIRLYRP